MKIAKKISLSFLLTSVVLTVVAVSIVYTIVRNNLEKSIFDHLVTAAESRANHIETFLEEHENLVQLLSTEILFMETLNSNKDNPEYHKKLESVNDRLKAVIKVHKDIIKTNLLDKNGVVIASSDKASVGSDKSDDEIFLNAKEATYIKDIHISKTAGIPALDFATPILVNNEFLGVIVTNLKAEELFNITLDRTGLGETGEIYLVNKDFYMISPSRFKEDIILKQQVDTLNSRNCLMQKDKEHILGLKKMSVFPDYRSIKVLGTHAYIPEMQWALLAEIDVKEAFAPLRFIKLIFILVLIVVPIIAWLVGVYVSRIISGPIHKLHKGTEIIATGNLDYKTNIDAKDEIGQLSRAFDKMTEDLKETTTSIVDLNKEIIERKQVEEELAKHRDHLEELVKERTIELSIAKEHAEAASRAKSEFLANMSHELRTPLNSIKGMIHLYLQTELTEQQKGYLQKLDSASRHLMKLINGVLDFSKIEKGDLKIEPSPFDLRGFLENLKSTYSPMAGKKNLDFVLSFTPEVPTMLEGDARRLSQILSNLLDNAIKFTEKGGVALRIDRESSNEQLTLCFEIEDTGIGMTQDQIGQLFQPFTQIDGSSTRMYGGTGLGLSLTKRLVEMMGGTISVESEKGIGSTFSFTAVFETVSKDMSAELEDADAWGVEAPETPSKTAEVEADTIEHLDVSIMAPKLAELSDLIRDDDTRAIRKFGEIKDDLKIPAIRGDVTILEKALEEYDFEDALAALDRIMGQIGLCE